MAQSDGSAGGGGACVTPAVAAGIGPRAGVRPGRARQGVYLFRYIVCRRAGGTFCKATRAAGRGSPLLLPRLPSSQLRIDEGVELAAVQDRFDVARLDARSDVLDASVVEDVVADLAAEAVGLGVADDSLQLGVALG